MVLLASLFILIYSSFVFVCSNNLVGVVTSQRPRDGSIPSRPSIFLFLQNIRASSGTYPISSSADTGCKAVGHGAEHIPPLTPKLRILMLYLHSSICFHDVQTDSFIFTFIL